MVVQTVMPSRTTTLLPPKWALLLTLGLAATAAAQPATGRAPTRATPPATATPAPAATPTQPPSTPPTTAPPQTNAPAVCTAPDPGWYIPPLYLVILASPMALVFLDVYWARRSGTGGAEPVGMAGLGRNVQGYMLVLLLGIVVFHLITFRPCLGTDQHADAEIVDKVVTVLVGGVASIIGFYFGGRAVEQGIKAAGTTPSPAGSVDAVDPSSGPAAAEVAVKGTGFGTAPGQVKIGGKRQSSPTAGPTRPYESRSQPH